MRAGWSGWPGEPGKPVRQAYRWMPRHRHMMHGSNIPRLCASPHRPSRRQHRDGRNWVGNLVNSCVYQALILATFSDVDLGKSLVHKFCHNSKDWRKDEPARIGIYRKVPFPRPIIWEAVRERPFGRTGQQHGRMRGEKWHYSIPYTALRFNAAQVTGHALSLGES